MATNKTTTKKIASKKEVKKLIPNYLICSFLYAFFGGKYLSVDGLIMTEDPVIDKELLSLGYQSWLVDHVADTVVKNNTGHLRTPSYKSNLEKFVWDFFKVEILKLKVNEYYIDTEEDNKNFNIITKGLEKLGFVTK